MASAATVFPAGRKGNRTRVLMRGTIFAPHGASVAWIRDISNEGALIAVEVDLPVDCDVIFKRGPIFVAAHVAWSRDGTAGLNFYRPLDDEALTSAHLPLSNRDD